MKVERLPSGQRIDVDFALALLRHFCPDLSWTPDNDIHRAEEAYYAAYHVWPDYDAMATQPGYCPAPPAAR